MRRIWAGGAPIRYAWPAPDLALAGHPLPDFEPVKFVGLPGHATLRRVEIAVGPGGGASVVRIEGAPGPLSRASCLVETARTFRTGLCSATSRAETVRGYNRINAGKVADIDKSPACPARRSHPCAHPQALPAARRAKGAATGRVIALSRQVV